MAEHAGVENGKWEGFRRVSIKGSGGELSVRVGGGGAKGAVLLAHSILTSSAVWHRQALMLASRGYLVIAPDTRGHGRSAASPPPYGMDELAEDVVAVLDGLDVDRVHYVGVSLGGMTGIGLALLSLHRLTSLCVVGARADAPPPFASAWDDRIKTVRAEGDVRALAVPTVDRWFGAGTIGLSQDERGALLACIDETSADGFVGCAQAIQKLDYLDRVAQIKTPTTLIVGEADTPMLQPIRDLALMIDGARVVVIGRAGHLPQLDQPADFDASLMSHLEGTEASH